MLATLLTLAAAANESGAGEPSKVPFYVAGLVLTAFAAVVAALGIVKHDFPSSRAATTAVIGVGALLVLATAVTSITTS